ncbi:MAG: 4Fe-4S ferredoxin [Spirochaetes bacterium GWF1_31_7]|nr:MAG: 4Fe-4S ferredoxin [Spirochaetes bacterium GWE1_32_154]OHD48013.1 MAG: 4Fe-4S ferredoxin [Spirochaetes bacterium GWF1_31_7]OHD49670.1 MAG: 4Fe-4S ferredoxin [Spirochaetes bacterium GWE2_31_10]OHD77101.1 MAG: 4Fe-4S ferredoxin [Spirochaetes bacterium RIFOXYB1_FULL_32_8]HBD92775.1 4Fe-4S ferredoxin [Spirochaetia bacterium]
MKSIVYFSDFKTRSHENSKIMKVRSLLNQDIYKNTISKDDLTAIKIHFGEYGNDSFINPIFVREAVDFIKKHSGKPFITDTNTLYSGSRHNSIDHLNTAISHGFAYAVVGAPLIIADGLRSENFKEIDINLKHFKKAKIAGDIESSDSMIVMTHFKAHEMAGFGGSIKNLAMGCAPAAGKRDQHSVRPFIITEKCVGCGKCQTICPENAITLNNKKALIDQHICIGCGECMTVCQVKAIGMNWDVELDEFIEKMTEYAYASVKNKKDKVLYINFVMNVVPDCDCAGWSDYPIVPDIGILISNDPVAIDKASYDLVNAQTGNKESILKENLEPGKDKFKGLRSNTNGMLQMTYGQSIGLGSMEYELIKI